MSDSIKFGVVAWLANSFLNHNILVLYIIVYYINYCMQFQKYK